MTLFDILKDIVSTKSGKLHKEFDFNTAFKSPYMIQRWISMEHPKNAFIVNETTNKIWRGLDNDKKLWYILLTCLTKKPVSYFKKINYIKKASEKTDEKYEKAVEMLAKSNEISQREIREHISMMERLNIKTEGIIGRYE